MTANKSWNPRAIAAAKTLREAEDKLSKLEGVLHDVNGQIHDARRDADKAQAAVSLHETDAAPKTPSSAGDTMVNTELGLVLDINPEFGFDE